MQPHFFEAADDEVEEARKWYRDQSEVAEAGFLRELDHAVDLIVEAPHRWPRYIAGTQRYVFPTYPYSLVYFVESNTVNVVAVAHESRRPGYWRKLAR
ncbi:MAG TPA: type II toxin-antitoxin system RelE/ParE family toxin [Thermoanaerobaculia bacterium]|nr:type II toxin-antitoxin system RelE/ParE family toxin [Thermoanaerobaculia bacterium]